MSFRHTSLAAAFLFGALCLTLILFPQIIYWLFQLERNDLGDFLANRAGMLFLGLAVLCFCLRGIEDRSVKRGVSLSIAAAMSGMALLGIVELARGNAGPGILVAIAVEAALAGLFMRHWRTANGAV